MAALATGPVASRRASASELNVDGYAFGLQLPSQKMYPLLFQLPSPQLLACTNVQ